MPSLPNPKHEMFAQGMAQGMSQAEAYEKAGYSPNEGSASRLHRVAKVRARIAEIIAGREQRFVLTKQWVIDKLIENANRAMQAEPVLDREGNHTGEWTYQGQVANRALELLGKELGMFVDKVDVSGRLQLSEEPAPVDVPKASDAWAEQFARPN